MSSDKLYMRKYMNDRYYRRKEKAITYLGGKCSICGCEKTLEFDHKDPKTKSFTIGNKLDSAPWCVIEEELDKCQLLCRNCHIEKSREEFNRDMPSGEDCSWSKLTEDEVREIRDRYEPYVVTQRNLAEEFGVSKSLIEQVVNRKIWKNI